MIVKAGSRYDHLARFTLICLPAYPLSPLSSFPAFPLCFEP
jgi:hypothetical protein